MDQKLLDLGLDPYDLPQKHRDELDGQGFTLFEKVIAPDWLDALRAAFDAVFEAEGEAAGGELGQVPGVRRLADLVNKGEVFDPVYLLPFLLTAVDYVLRRPFKLHSLNGHDPLPGQGQQALHRDTGLPRTGPDHFHVVNSMWMLDDFTPDSGPTRVVPGTHRWLDDIADHVEDRLESHADEVLLIAPAGSIGVFNGSLWHSCTGNRTRNKRRTLHCAFIAREHPQQTDQRQYLRPETETRLSPLARYVLDV